MYLARLNLQLDGLISPTRSFIDPQITPSFSAFFNTYNVEKLGKGWDEAAHAHSALTLTFLASLAGCLAEFSLANTLKQWHISLRDTAHTHVG